MPNRENHVFTVLSSNANSSENDLVLVAGGQFLVR